MNKQKKDTKSVRNIPYCVALGAHIRKIREQQGYSLRGFAADLNIEYNQLYRVEKGKVNTSVSMLFKIAEGLQVHPKELLDFAYPAKKR